MTIPFNFDKVLLALFCGYAFSLPYELVFEYFLDIDTIFKPFRICSILILSVFGLKVLNKGFKINLNELSDGFLYAVLFYGLIISCFRIIGTTFKMGVFLNDAIQVSLHIGTFFVFKNTSLTKAEGLKILKYFVLGISLNAFYISYQFIINSIWGRQSGFTQNPNYVAFGLVAGVVYLILKTELKSTRNRKILYFATIIMLLYTFGAQGSRTGFVILLISLVIIFFFSSFRRKLVFSFMMLLIFFILLPRNVDRGFKTGPMVLIDRLKKTFEEEEDVRFVVWRGIFRALEDTGYAGMGIGQFKAKFPSYYGEESNKLVLEIVNRGYYLSPHNDYLAILTDYGLPGLVFYLIFLTFNGFVLFRRVVYPPEDEDAIFLAKLSFTFFMCIIVFGMGAENFNHQLYWFLIMFTTKRFV